MELKFELKPGQQYMTIDRLLQLEESIGWLTNATAMMVNDASVGNYVFVENDGTKSSMSDQIVRTIQQVGLANLERAKLILELNMTVYIPTT